MNSYEPRGVVVETRAFLEGVARDGTLLPVTFAYVASDPYAVSMLIHTAGPAVPWTFARELIADGLNRPTGEGDVLITPTAEGVRIGLTSPTGVAILKVGRAPLERLIEQTELLVPLGAESEHVDWDYALSTLAPGGER